MVIKEETPQGVTLELLPEEAADLLASLETHTFVDGTAAELDRQLRDAGVAPAAPPAEIEPPQEGAFPP